GTAVCAYDSQPATTCRQTRPRLLWSARAFALRWAMFTERGWVRSISRRITIWDARSTSAGALPTARPDAFNVNHCRGKISAVAPALRCAKFLVYTGVIAARTSGRGYER